MSKRKSCWLIVYRRNYDDFSSGIPEISNGLWSFSTEFPDNKWLKMFQKTYEVVYMRKVVDTNQKRVSIPPMLINSW